MGYSFGSRVQGGVKELLIYTNDGQKLELELTWRHWTFSAHPQQLTLKHLVACHPRLQKFSPAPGGFGKSW